MKDRREKKSFFLEWVLFEGGGHKERGMKVYICFVSIYKNR
jgi:hypothetical protein